MGASGSNCCGAKYGQYKIPDDPDIGTIQKKRRFQNIDTSISNASILKRSHSVNNKYKTHHHDRFEIKGEIIVSHSFDLLKSNSLPYGITINLNGFTNEFEKYESSESESQDISSLSGIYEYDQEKQESNLLSPEKVENLNKKEIDKLEFEMLKEMRRLSQISIPSNNID